MKKLVSALAVLAYLSACGPAETPSIPSRIVRVYATSAAGPWLADIYDCAASVAAVAELTDPATAEIMLQIGEPAQLTTPAFQIDLEEILIVTHRESPLQDLTADGARLLFAGQGDPSVQVWVYASGEDVQESFERLVMAGRSVTPAARLAASPQHMSGLLNTDRAAVGILPRRWKVGDARVIFSAGTVPVLAVVKASPQGVVRDLLACLQK